jgi:hypothetical protein
VPQKKGFPLQSLTQNDKTLVDFYFNLPSIDKKIEEIVQQKNVFQD